MIFDFSNLETLNADIEFQEGYLDGDSQFVSLGVNKLHIANQPEVTDDEGNVTTPATTDYSDFLTLVGAAEVIDVDFIENYLTENIA